MKVSVFDANGQQVGDTVDDNAYQHDGDGYRFHDVIHLVFMAHFGWSPVYRKLLNLKRKSNSEKDRADDGARARDIEESISHRIFIYIRRYSYLAGVRIIDTSFLRGLREESQGREIKLVTERQWELAMLEAAHVIRQLIEHRGGYVIADNLTRHVIFQANARCCIGGETTVNSLSLYTPFPFDKAYSISRFVPSPKYPPTSTTKIASLLSIFRKCISSNTKSLKV